MNKSLIVLACLLSSYSAFAFDYDCSNEKSTTDILACLNDGYARADKVLNLVWKNLEKNEELVANQREWIKRRDERCEEAAQKGNGSVAKMLRLDCLIDQTLEQTLGLASLLK